ncbi:alpha/beta fold hydrolase [Actinocorallia longicatena]|uniref:Alpha/beta fold hydrolase n=1 Tax=Actinocorallia longicatena TaxID=111803 RepID=A0ABP6Q8M7_9ACTN
MLTSDGVRLAARHHPGPADGPCVIVGHGFTCSQRMKELRHIAGILGRDAAVLALDFRGHGGSGGLSTVGDLEIHDLQAAVEWAGSRYRGVAVVGFSMGASAAIRHAALMGGVDAVVSVSSPARWYYRDTVPMRRVHWAVESRLGRAAVRIGRRTRIAASGWDPVPEAPNEVIGRISCPVLVVHGDADGFFPVDHGLTLYEAAGEPRELWIEPGFGHAEIAASEDLIARISAWVHATVSGRLRS